jgi:Domain of unknown function (DUF4386)
MKTQTATLAEPWNPAPLSTVRPTRILGWCMIIVFLFAGIGIGTLTATFNFPDVLRATTANTLPLYLKNEVAIRASYWLLAMSGLIFAGIAAAFRRSFAHRGGGASDLAGTFGVLTGIFWALGFIRWAVTVPYLATRYANDPTSDAVNTMHEVLNRYAGMAVGEHLGFLTMGAFAIFASIAWRRAELGARWITPLGYFAGIFIAVTAGEQVATSLRILGDLNGPANVVWFAWLAAMGTVLVRRRSIS